MGARAGDWDLVRIRKAAVHRWLAQNAFETADGRRLWVGEISSLCPQAMGQIHTVNQKRLLHKLEDENKIDAVYRRPFWTIDVLKFPPSDRSDLPPPPDRRTALRFAASDEATEHAFNRREALWFWLYGQADDHMVVEMPSDRIP